MFQFCIRFFTKYLVKTQLYSGFTLSEVLVTLAVIGVVAAMTIPIINNAIQESQLKSAWKKEFSVINQAYINVKEDEGGDLSAYFDGTTLNISLPLSYKIKNKLSVIKSCGNISYVCGTDNKVLLTDNKVYKTLSDSYLGYTNLYADQYILSDGAQIYVRAYDPANLFIWVDVNGYVKKPNVLGRDVFGLVINKNKLIPMGALGSGVENSCSESEFTCPINATFIYGTGSCAGAGCSAEVLYK